MQSALLHLRNWPRSWLLLSVLLIGIGFDQLSKSVARSALEEGTVHRCCADTMRIQLAYNDGAFLSLGGSLPKETRDLLFRGGVLLLLVIMLIYTLRARDLSQLAAIGFALCIAGGGGNLIDRWLHDGAVVDFLNVGVGGLRTGIFNLADMYIMAGAGVIIYSEYVAGRGNGKRVEL